MASASLLKTVEGIISGVTSAMCDLKEDELL
jgi:hypothetical protein